MHVTFILFSIRTGYFNSFRIYFDSLHLAWFLLFLVCFFPWVLVHSSQVSICMYLAWHFVGAGRNITYLRPHRAGGKLFPRTAAGGFLGLVGG